MSEHRETFFMYIAAEKKEVKIGKTKRDLQKRVNEIKEPIHVIKAVKVNDAQKCKSNMTKKYGDKMSGNTTISEYDRGFTDTLWFPDTPYEEIHGVDKEKITKQQNKKLSKKINKKKIE